MALRNDDALSKSGQVAAPGRRRLLTSAAAGLVAGAGAVAAGAVIAPRPAEAGPRPAEAGPRPAEAGPVDPMVTIAPSGDPTGAADATAINGALSAGQAVQLTPGTYYVDVPIEIPVSGILQGAGRGQVDADTMTVIKATASMAAVMCSYGWLEGTNTSTQGGIKITDLKVDGANLATHGIVVQNYSSLIRDVYVSSVSNASGTTGDGIRFDAVSADGSATISGSGVNNQVIRCLAEDCFRAYATNDPHGIFTDGFIVDSFAATIRGVAGICIGNVTGWRIAGNHLYGLSGHGIQVGQMYMTRITDNYIETWGSSTTANTWYGIDAYNLGNSDEGSGSVISGNTLNLYHAPGNTGSAVVGIGFGCDAGNTASLSVTGNLMRCAPSSGYTHSYGIAWICKALTSVIYAVSTGNLMTGNWTNAVSQQLNGGAIHLSAGV